MDDQPGSVPERTPAPRKVLVVDDVPANVRLLRAFLETAGYEVITAASGERALERVREQPPDIVLLDIMMPHLNGFDTCRSIKEDPRTRNVPVILVTSLSAVQDKILGERAGADDFVTKPFERQALLVRVRSMLRIKELHDQLQDKVAELERTKAELRRLADTDALTGLHNKRYLVAFLGRELARARRYDRPISVAMLDIDHFKRFNDTLGHPAGDALLQQLATLLRDGIRAIDIAVRYGGEEFLLVLLETGPQDAARIAEKIRSRIAEHRFTIERDGPTHSVTVSLGVATFPHDGLDADDLIQAADRRLYEAKVAGRDRVVAGPVARRPTPPSSAEPDTEPTGR